MNNTETEKLIALAKSVSAEIKPLMLAGKFTASAAESCTGGMVSALITEIPGSSEYFKGGVVSYTNEIKKAFLCVKKETLDKYTAVSEQTAREMAEGIRKGMKSTFGLSITGLAGPGGASPGIPVGTVYMGLSSPQGTQVFHKVFGGDRASVRAQAALFILQKLKETLKNYR